MTKGKFQVGLPHYLGEDDPWFHDEKEAIEAANILHNKGFPFKRETVGVYDEHGEILWLFFAGEQFRKV